jgi:mono/diheme cytochrome c family protein
MKRAGFFVAALLCAPLAANAEPTEQSLQLAPGAAKDLAVSRCVICHSVDYIEMVAPVMNRATWEKTIRKMVDVFGAPVTDDEARQILDYLSEHYSGSPAG